VEWFLIYIIVGIGARAWNWRSERRPPQKAAATNAKASGLNPGRYKGEGTGLPFKAQGKKTRRYKGRG
jgi:hypothetical protein